MSPVLAADPQRAPLAAPHQAGALVAPLWHRLRFWLAVVGVLAVGGIVLALISPAPGRPLDPNSAGQDGSAALAALLTGSGVSVQRVTSLPATGPGAPSLGAAVVLVVEPDDYSSAQLSALWAATGAASGRLVLLDPDQAVLTAVAPQLSVADPLSDPSTDPRCADAGAQASGPVDLSGATTFTGAGPTADCYDGAVRLDAGLAVLGSADLLRNDHLARAGVAALDINTITADRTRTQVVWLLPGSDATGAGAPSIWQLFPAGARRAFDWLLLVGLLLVLWRARRLGPAVREPLPVVVRATEVVTGHGRLYAAAGARAEAASALRRASAARLRSRLGLARRRGADTDGAMLGAAVAAAAGRDGVAVTALLTGPAPTDDAGLLALAGALDELESAVEDPSAPQTGAQP